jgi:hypothetical protein
VVPVAGQSGARASVLSRHSISYVGPSSPSQTIGIVQNVTLQVPPWIIVHGSSFMDHRSDATMSPWVAIDANEMRGRSITVTMGLPIRGSLPWRFRARF